MAAEVCEFAALWGARFRGEGAEGDEGLEDVLEAHLEEGCAECERAIERALEGSDVQAPVELESRLSATLEDVGARIEGGQARVLEAVRERVQVESPPLVRRLRRRSLRVVFYVTNVTAIFLMGAIFLGTLAMTRFAVREEQTAAARTEVQALVTALSRYVQDHQELPGDVGGLIEALASSRPDSATPYYPFSEGRRTEEGGYRDAFGRPLRYRAGQGRALIYSVGADGEDDQGRGDDLGAWVYFTHESR